MKKVFHMCFFYRCVLCECSEIVKTFSDVHLDLLTSSWPRPWLSCWRPSGEPFRPLYNTTLCKNTQTCQHCGFVVCSAVVSMCLCFASGCRLCKSWAGASSQPGGQTRKQMDLFGLNPSHATSSSGPLPTCPPLCRVEGIEQSGFMCVSMWFGGWDTRSC